MQYEYSHSQQRAHPPFTVFAQYLREQAQREAARPYSGSLSDTQVPKNVMTAKVLATSVAKAFSYCFEHQTTSHPLSKCKKFGLRTIEERQALVREHRLCYGCLCTGHSIKDCKIRLSCDTCEGKHPTVMHSSIPPKKKDQSTPSSTPAQPSEPPSTKSSPSPEFDFVSSHHVATRSTLR